METRADQALNVFFSYSHVDEALRDELAKHLSILRRSGVIHSWHDRRISAGTDWSGQIDENIETADVILLLISSDFLASDYCYDIELKRAMERHQAGEARVVPIILRPVDWAGASFGSLQALPKDAKPVTSTQAWNSLDEAFVDVVRGIRETVRDITLQRQAVAGPAAKEGADARSPSIPSPGSSGAPAEEMITGLEAARTADTAAMPPAAAVAVRVDPAPQPSQVQPPQAYSPPPQAPAPAPAAAAALPFPPSNLPRITSPLVGRTDELSLFELRLADPDCLIVTLLGPGGTGKTRLVTEVARRALEAGRFPDGVHFVPLDPLEDADLIPATIAGVLGLELQGQEPALDQVLRHIGNRTALLVLDNYEHVMDGADLPGELVRACPNLKILVTSRERLNLEEEWVLPLTGLAVPKLDHDTAEAAERYDSVQLFVQRAKRANLHFSLADEDPAQVCRICRLVAGSPLGIELAAAWVKMMPCHEIAGEIQSHIDFLTSTSRNVSERHRSVRACFEYSWALLSPKEREVLSRLSVFHGGFTREAAAEVAGGSLPVLMSLLDKSLLQVEGGRYENHPLLRRYAGEKLSEQPQVQEDAETRHGQYYLRYLDGCNGQEDVLGKLDLELDNVLSAMQTASRRGDDRTLVDFMRLLAVDGTYYASRGHTPHSRELLKEAVAAAKRLQDLEAAHRLLGKLGDEYRKSQGDLDLALEAYRESLGLAEQLQDPHRQVVMLSMIGEMRFQQGADDADSYLERGYQLARDHDDGLALTHVLQHMGILAGMRNDLEACRRIFREALEVVEKLAAGRQVRPLEVGPLRFKALINLGEAERMLGNFEVSLELRQRALAMAEQHNNRRWKAEALHEIGELYHSMDRRDLAREQLNLALALWRQNNNFVQVESLTAFMKAKGYPIGIGQV